MIYRVVWCFGNWGKQSVRVKFSVLGLIFTPKFQHRRDPVTRSDCFPKGGLRPGAGFVPEVKVKGQGQRSRSKVLPQNFSMPEIQLLGTTVFRRAGLGLGVVFCLEVKVKSK